MSVRLVTSGDIEFASTTDSSDSAPPQTRGPRLRSWMIAGLVLILMLGGYLAFRGRAPSSSPVQSHPSLTVDRVSPRRVVWPKTLNAMGAIAAWEEASIGTQIGSYQLVEIRANVGDQVRRGQVLARLNPALLEAERTQLQARHDQAIANDRRARELQRVGGISDQEALQFATEAKTAGALLAAKQLELTYTKIIAPDDGAITARTATLGAVMPAGQELFRMIRRNRLEWRGEFLASQLNEITVGQKIVLKLSDGSRADASIRSIAPALDVQSRIAIIYADITPNRRARAGMYVAGEIVIGQTSALAIPASSVIIRDGHSYVAQLLSADATSKVRLRAVVTGRRKGSAIEIVRGLRGTEQLVLRGGAFLNSGDIVRIASDQRAAQ